MDEKELMDNLMNTMERRKEYEKKKLIADKKNETELQELVDFINSIFAKYQITDRITTQHIRFNAEFVGNIIKVDDKKLS